jgi:hypothetical protein
MVLHLVTKFLKGFLSWVCDQRRGKGGRRRPGIRYISSLEIFWKWYQLVYKLEAGKRIDDMIIRQGQDIIESNNPSRVGSDANEVLGGQDCGQ